jgi:predicted O-methyltransferase YrrM
MRGAHFMAGSVNTSSGSLKQQQMLAAVTASGGLLVEAEAIVLYRLASSLPDGARILEIGSFLGGSTTAIGHGILSRGCELYCLDCWHDYRTQGFIDSGLVPKNASDFEIMSRFLSTTSFLGDQIRILKGRSNQFASLLPDQFFDVVFVDGAHDYESVIFDMALALRVIKPSGLICGHDYHMDGPGVVQAVDESINTHAGISIKGVFPQTTIWYAVAPVRD